MKMPLPDASTFFCTLHTAQPRDAVAGWFGAAGWRVRTAGQAEVEVAVPWAELVLEGDAPLLLHGPVADVEARMDAVLAVLRRDGVAFVAEGYDTEGGLLRTVEEGRG